MAETPIQVRHLAEGDTVRMHGMAPGCGTVLELRRPTDAEIADYRRIRHMPASQPHGPLMHVTIHWPTRRRPGATEWGLTSEYTFADGASLLLVTDD